MPADWALDTGTAPDTRPPTEAQGSSVDPVAETGDASPPSPLPEEPQDAEEEAAVPESNDKDFVVGDPVSDTSTQQAVRYRGPSTSVYAACTLSQYHCHLLQHSALWDCLEALVLRRGILNSFAVRSAILS